jgi:Leucine-rich repeat (LRR) protein
MLFSNNIPNIPDSISSRVNLQHLDLSNNKIADIPDSISSLVNLQRLYLDIIFVLMIYQMAFDKSSMSIKHINF